MTLQELRNAFKAKLEGCYPETEVESFFRILAEAYLNMEHWEVALHLEKVIVEKEVSNFNKAEMRLLNFEPIQYILGTTEFYGLTLKVTPHVLIPRPETEELVTWILDDHKHESPSTILDIGTGSGCIAIALAKHLRSKVSAIDVSEDALSLAIENARAHDADVQFQLDNILELEFLQKQYSVIVSNPPYVRLSEKEKMQANVLEYEPHLALFVSNSDALVFYRKITQLGAKNLRHGGSLYFEINEELAEGIVALLTSQGFQDIVVKKDMYNKDRMVRATWYE